MYTSFYNLREEPFRLTSDPRFFHLAEPHAVALAALIEAVMRRKGFVLMTGPIGTGIYEYPETHTRVFTKGAAPADATPRRGRAAAPRRSRCARTPCSSC